MPWIAANGILVLGPSVLYLASKAGAGEFDSGFYAVQATELVVGVTNIALLGLNMRDGLRMKGRFRRRSS
jgi:Na+/H+ antiporter NhaA